MAEGEAAAHDATTTKHRDVDFFAGSTRFEIELEVRVTTALSFA